MSYTPNESSTKPEDRSFGSQSSPTGRYAGDNPPAQHGRFYLLWLVLAVILIIL